MEYSLGIQPSLQYCIIIKSVINYINLGVYVLILKIQILILIFKNYKTYGIMMMRERSCKENFLLLRLMFLEQSPIGLLNVMNLKVLHFFILISIKCTQQFFILVVLLNIMIVSYVFSFQDMSHVLMVILILMENQF